MGKALLARANSNSTSSSVNLLDGVNVGDMIESAKTITDSRFIKCRGQTVYSTTYPELYTAISNRYIAEADTTGWVSFTPSTDAIVYQIGDLYFKEGTSCWQYSEDGVNNWTNLPYEGKPYYTCGIYMLDSGYVCKSVANLKSKTWHKITFSTATPASIEVEYNWSTEDGDFGTDYVTLTFSVASRQYFITDNSVFILCLWETESASDTDTTQVAYQETTLISIDAEELFESIDEKSDGNLLLHNTEDWVRYGYNEESGDSYEDYSDGYVCRAIVTKNGDLIGLEGGGSMYGYATIYKTNTTSEPPTSITSLGGGNYMQTDPTYTIICVNGTHSWQLDQTVYVNGGKVTLPTVCTGITAIGYSSVNNSIVYISRYTSTSKANGSTYAYSLDTKTSTYIGIYKKYGQRDVMSHDDTDGHVYYKTILSGTYKAMFSTLKKYTLPSQSSNAETEYMKVST